MKIHLLGPSGSGTSTIGKKLSEWLKTPLFESDDIFWKETGIPYTEARSQEERKEKLHNILKQNDSWIIAGSALGWGDSLLEKAELIVLLYLNAEDRKKRLQQREYKQFGDRIRYGGDMFEIHRDFIKWAMKYDKGDMDMRSLKSEEAWVQKAHCPVLRITNDNENKTLEQILPLCRIR